MDALRSELGDAVFWDGLRRYTREHAGGSVTSRDLQAAMERAAGRKLGALFDKWVY
jgi:aminopeptidase N